MKKNILFLVALVITTLLISTGCNTPNSPAASSPQEKPTIPSSSDTTAQTPDLVGKPMWQDQNDNSKIIYFDNDGKKATVSGQDIKGQGGTETGDYSVEGNKVTVTLSDKKSKTFTYENGSLTGTWWDGKQVTLKQEK